MTRFRSFSIDCHPHRRKHSRPKAKGVSGVVAAGRFALDVDADDWAKGSELFCYYEDRADLDNKLQVLENLGFVRSITYNNAKRFTFAEHFVDWLVGEGAA